MTGVRQLIGFATLVAARFVARWIEREYIRPPKGWAAKHDREVEARARAHAEEARQERMRQGGRERHSRRRRPKGRS